MSLIKQKQGIIDVARNGSGGKGFPTISCEQDTYFISYHDSKHMSQTVMSYDSEFRKIKEYLEYMWEKSLCESYGKEIMSAIYENKDNQVGMLEEIDLYNYMM